MLCWLLDNESWKIAKLESGKICSAVAIVCVTMKIKRVAKAWQGENKICIPGKKCCYATIQEVAGDLIWYKCEFRNIK